MGDIGPQNDNGRRHERIGLSLLVQLRCESRDDFDRRFAANISIGGMFIETEDNHAIGDVVYFQCTVRGDGPIIEGMGRVVHTSPASSTAPGGIGVEFLNMEPQFQRLIRNIVDARAGMATLRGA